MHPLDLANHVHGDHLFALLKKTAKQWNTLVSFRSANLASDDQFSVGANTPGLLVRTGTGHHGSIAAFHQCGKMPKVIEGWGRSGR
jgi:hypothetical protein